MKQVGPTEDDVPPTPLVICEPSVGEGSHPKARVDPPRLCEVDKDEVVEVTPNVPPPVSAKRKCNEGAERSSQRKKSRALFNL